MFAALGAGAAAAGERTDGSGTQAGDEPKSNWKNASRREALR
jgi:hypothetical protein